MTTSAVTASGLGKRYGRHWALSECTLSIPAGRVVGLVGPNGAGKSTLIGLMTGLLGPSTGSIEVLGGPPPTARRSWRASATWRRARRPTPA